MKVILVRHAKKGLPQGAVSDAELGIDVLEIQRIKALREWLVSRSLEPRHILTSGYRHAVETAEHLRCKRTRCVVPSTGLTPHTSATDFSFWAILHEANTNGVTTDHDDVLVLVGHELRLSNLAHAITGDFRPDQLKHAEALVLDVTAAVETSFCPQ